MIRIRKDKGIQGVYRAFDEELDSPFIQMRMIAIRQAHEMMEHGVSERDNPSTFLA
jgi:hypothetical protein